MNWFRQFFTRRQMDSDLSEEIEQHPTEKMEALMGGGVSCREAVLAARREFGNIARIKERSREVWMWPMVESIFADAKCFAGGCARYETCLARSAGLSIARRHTCAWLVIQENRFHFYCRECKRRRQQSLASRLPQWQIRYPFSPGGGWFVYRQGTTEFLFSHMEFAAMTFLISPGYLEMAKTRLMSGREFTWHDDAKSPRVAIVNETFARKLFGKGSAIGQHFLLWASARYEVVGVVEDGKYNSLIEDPHPAMFVPMAQGVGVGHQPTRVMVVVRSQLPEDQITAALRKTLAGIEPNVPLL
jgi:hypothetical protein